MQASPVVHNAAVDALRTTGGQTRTGSWNKPSHKKQVTSVCHKCGNTHEPRQCQAYGAVCHKCGKKNNFSKVCRVSTEESSSYRPKTMNNIESDVYSLYIGLIGNENKKKAAHQAKGTVWHVTASIRGVAINFKQDTGADANVLPIPAATRSHSVEAYIDCANSFWWSTPTSRRRCIFRMQDVQKRSCTELSCEYFQTSLFWVERHVRSCSW